MPHAVDLTQTYALKRFHRTPPKRLGLWGTLIASNLIWLALFIIVGSLMFLLSKFASTMASNYLREKWEHSEMKKLTAKELAERDMKIARLIDYNASSAMDIVALGRKISTVIDSAHPRHRAFFEKALPEAMHIQVTYGIPASAVMAQAIYESGYGRSKLAKEHNNFFGIKAFNDWKGERASNMPTRDNGILTTADFRAYPTMKDGFRGYAEFLTDSQRYQNAFNTHSGEKFVSAILKAGYCPDSTYLPNIRRIMANHHLQELDEILETTTTTNPAKIAAAAEEKIEAISSEASQKVEQQIHPAEKPQPVAE